MADDGRSIRSKKSNSMDPFSERPSSSGITRTPTNFDISLRDDMSISPSVNRIPDLPSRPQSSRSSLLKGIKLTGSPPADDPASLSFDAMLSSSPMAESTPRLRLEPTQDEDGKRTLRSVRADSRSIFDHDISSLGPSDMETDHTRPHYLTETPPRDSVKRKSSQIKEGGMFKLHSKRTKKHPSPSKTELEGLQASLKVHPEFGISESHDDLESSQALEQNPDAVETLFHAPPLLAPKDPNSKVTGEAKAIEKRMGFGMFPKRDLGRPSVSTSDVPRRPNAQKSMIPRPAEPTSTRSYGPRFSLRGDFGNNTAMDIDELQRDESAYDISTKKKA